MVSDVLLGLKRFILFDEMVVEMLLVALDHGRYWIVLIRNGQKSQNG